MQKICQLHSRLPHPAKRPWIRSWMRFSLTKQIEYEMMVSTDRLLEPRTLKDHVFLVERFQSLPESMVSTPRTDRVRVKHYF